MSYNGIRKAKMEFCFGSTGTNATTSGIKASHASACDIRFSWFFTVMTLKAFSVSWMTIPETPTKQGFLLRFTGMDGGQIMDISITMSDELVIMDP